MSIAKNKSIFLLDQKYLYKLKDRNTNLCRVLWKFVSPLFSSHSVFSKISKLANSIFKTSSVFNCNCNCLVPLQYWWTLQHWIQWYSVHSSSMLCKSILGLVDTHYDLVCRTEVFGTKLKFCQTTLTLSAFVISFFCAIRG